jgi:hypothetical protein
MDGFEKMGLLTKQFPWPIMGVMGEVEIAGPAGMPMYEPQQSKTAFQGSITFEETVTGMVHEFTRDVIVTNGGIIPAATIYEGTPDRFYRAIRIRDAFFLFDNVDRDWENRSQVTLVNGTIFFHYFGEVVPGNIA